MRRHDQEEAGLASAALVEQLHPGHDGPRAGRIRDEVECLRTRAPPRAEGYVGCWYSVGPTKDEYKYKYSGGMATYPQQHAPIAVYDEESNRTYFVYGGADPARKSILHMVSYYGHATKTVPRPAILLDKKTNDAHDNPTLQIDAEGRVWIFSNAHGTGRPSFIHRSVGPRSIDAFQRVLETNFSYGDPWYVPGRGFLFLHTKYASGRALRFMTSADGLSWSEPAPLVKIDRGDYQVTWGRGGTVASAFDFHPKPLGLDAGTNLYYLQSRDFGSTWTTAAAAPVELPLSQPSNPALVHDYQAEKKLVYLKDLNFDADGRPVVLFLTSKGHQPGPQGGPRAWSTARWTGSEWTIRPFTTSDHNYDHGSLYIEADGLWRVIAPTEPGAQPFGTGGDMVMWTSRDQGGTWTRVKQLTSDPKRNHTYARRRASRLLLPLGRRRRPRAVRIVALLHRQARHARLAAPVGNVRRFGPPRSRRVSRTAEPFRDLLPAAVSQGTPRRPSPWIADDSAATPAG